MPLWNATTPPQWLLGEDENGEGLGSNHIKGITNVTDGNEIETVDDLAGIGWIQWHSKENGKILGEGRGWWEILATMGGDGANVTVNTRPVLASAINVEVTQAQVNSGGGQVEIDILATDDTFGGTLTYILKQSTADGATLPIPTDGTVIINGTPGTFSWNVEDEEGVTMAQDVTVTITNPDPTVADVSDLEYSIGSPPANVQETLTGDVGLVNGTVTGYTVDASGSIQREDSTSSATAVVDNAGSLVITVTDNDLVVGDIITFGYTMTNSGGQISDSAVITVTVVA